MAESHFKKAGVRDAIKPIFATGMPSMFAVPKYGQALNKMREERNVDGLFQHNLVAVDGDKKVATFAKPDGSKVDINFDLLHAVPPQGPLDFIKTSPLADEAGWVNVDKDTTQHLKFNNIFALGDGSSLPNSKTMAAAASQAPVLVDNLRAHMDGKPLPAKYGPSAPFSVLMGMSNFLPPACRWLCIVPTADRLQRAHACRVQVRWRAQGDLRLVAFHQITGHSSQLVLLPQERFLPLGVLELLREGGPPALFHVSAFSS